MALRIGVDLRLFHILNNKQGLSLSADELSREAKSEFLLTGMNLEPQSP